MRIFLLLAFVLTLAACGTSSKKQEDAALTADRPVEQIYNEAADAMDANSYRKAAKLFAEVERQHPYSQWATQADLMRAFALYKDAQYDEAAVTLDDFIRLHPGYKDIDYAYYLRGLCDYDQITDVKRDQETTAQALQSFDTLLRLFPESKYARDAKLKRDLTLDHLAGKEMDIGRYYLTRGYYTAAVKRFMVVVHDYQTTTHVPEALHRLVEAYLHMGLVDEATRVAAVLGYNYPGSKWYADSYRILNPQQREKLMDDRSFKDRTIDALFKPE
ncbi:MAG: outer membrane protein assembly factor BamD [Rhodospirillales bacterium]|nr:outer membrane protein assembly factor BamD [Alphaproteobacteria bacterium]MCB9986999.1 outer membrane protein assembly factor BamD [Rhodospirillales bacterium]USO08228.1 MAG: outer membrane protein assembly factor BamD [Rhodospirillales bacterium]